MGGPPGFSALAWDRLRVEFSFRRPGPRVLAKYKKEITIKKIRDRQGVKIPVM
jgi:hypothetical protein